MALDSANSINYLGKKFFNTTGPVWRGLWNVLFLGHRLVVVEKEVLGHFGSGMGFTLARHRGA